MAEFLLNEENRKRLADLLHEAACPEGLDHGMYLALQRGDRSAISMRSLAAISKVCGSGAVYALKQTTR
jgi:hypothetical protein